MVASTKGKGRGMARSVKGIVIPGEQDDAIHGNELSEPVSKNYPIVTYSETYTSHIVGGNHISDKISLSTTHLSHFSSKNLIYKAALGSDYNGNSD